MYDIPKLNGEDVTNLNRSITSNTIDVVTRISYPKTPGLERFTDQFCQTFKEESTSKVSKLKLKGTVRNTFYKGSILDAKTI